MNLCKMCKGTGRVMHLHTQEGSDAVASEATCSVCSGTGKISNKQTIITVNIIDHEDQWYDTVGDWRFDSDYNHLTVTVSRTTEESIILVAIHEIIEAILCRLNGVSEEVVDAFDMANIDHPDPGSIPGCPYYREHMFATMIERAMAAEMQVNWEDHEMNLENL